MTKSNTHLLHFHQFPSGSFDFLVLNLDLSSNAGNFLALQRILWLGEQKVIFVPKLKDGQGERVMLLQRLHCKLSQINIALHVMSYVRLLPS